MKTVGYQYFEYLACPDIRNSYLEKAHMTFFIIYLLIGLALSISGPLATKTNAEISKTKFTAAMNMVNPPSRYKVWAFIIVLRLLVLFFYPVLYVMLFVDYLNHVNKNQKGKMADMEDDNSLPGKNDDRLYFWKMGGAGEVICLECGNREEIISFTHGDGYTEGLQCQQCGRFSTATEKDTYPVTCECGGNMERLKPLFCPKCKSFNLKYHMAYIT